MPQPHLVQTLAAKYSHAVQMACRSATCSSVQRGAPAATCDTAALAKLPIRSSSGGGSLLARAARRALTSDAARSLDFKSDPRCCSSAAASGVLWVAN